MNVKKITPCLLSFLLSVFFVLSVQQSQASHAMGADIAYECIDPATNTYKVTLRFYRDCFGIDASTSVFVDVTSVSCGQNLSLTLDREACPPQTNGGAPCEVSPLCPTAIGQSTCNGGSYPGVMAYTFTGTIQLPMQCTDWVFSFSECCRNAQITNLQTPDSEDLYVEARLNNVLGGCNSSPVFTTLPVPFICANQPFSYNHGAVDPDGDSLYYSLVNPLTIGGAPITYVFPFTPTQPMNTTPANSFNFDNNTGQMFFTPNGVQVAVITVLVEEYRNGVLIGSTTRDIQVVVVNLPGCANPAPLFTGAIPATVTGGFYINPFNVQVCPGTVLTFNTLSVEQTGDSIFVETNIAQSIPGAQFSSQYLSADSIASFFSWTPSGLDTGQNVFIVTIKNNNCPLSSNQAYAITIDVLAGTYAGPDLSYCPAGGPVQLQAYGGNQFTWTPALGLDNPNIGNPVASPAQTTDYIVTSNLSNTCKNKDTVTVYRVPDFNYTITQSDDTICRFEFVNFNVVPEAGFGPYTYAWTPTGSLNSSTVANPTAQPDVSTTYTLVVTSDTGCVIRDTTTYVVVEGQGPLVRISADKTKVCVGDTIQLSSVVSVLPCGLNVVPCQGNYVLKNVGTGTTIDVTGATPFRGFYEDTRMQILFRASELQALGMTAGTISDIVFDVAVQASTQPYDGFSLKMGCTDLTALTTIVPNLPVVMAPMQVQPTVGPNTFTFTNPYDWDGVSNLILEVCFDNNSWTDDDDVNATPTSYNSVLFQFQDGSAGCNLNGFVNLSTNRPNVQFVYCVEPPANITYSWSPTTNLFSPDSLNPIVVLDDNREYFLTANDGSCSGGSSIVLNIDTSFGINAGPDLPFCSGNPAQLFAQVTGTPPTGQLGACGTNGTPCSNASAPLRTLNLPGASAGFNTPFDGDFFSTQFEDQRTQILYRAADLIAAGYTAGTISQIGLNISAKASAFPFQNLSVKLGCTSKTALDDNGWEPTSVVYTNILYATVLGWNDFVLQNTYTWDGTSNLVLEICWDNPDGFPSTGADLVQTAFVPYSCFHSGSSFFDVGCNISAPTFGLFTELPEMRAKICPAPPVPVTYVWTPNLSLTDDSISNPLASPAQATTYTITAYFGGKCPKVDDVVVTPQNFNYLVMNDSSVCEGQSLTLSALGGNAYSWFPASTLSCSDCPNPVASPLPPSSVYFVTITDTTTGCTHTDTVEISVSALQATALYYDTLVDQGTAIVLGADVTGGAGPGSYTYAWSPADYLDNANAASPVATPLADRLYVLSVTSGPCTDTTQINVRVNIIESPVAMPNAFSPNGDGKNDLFGPVFAGANTLARIKSFRIYNRYGEMVHDGTQGWDGNFKGKGQPAGTYIYYIVIERPFKDDEGLQGSFTLLR
jgi:gliding motility-associated-like protein